MYKVFVKVHKAVNTGSTVHLVSPLQWSLRDNLFPRINRSEKLPQIVLVEEGIAKSFTMALSASPVSANLHDNDDDCHSPVPLGPEITKTTQAATDTATGSVKTPAPQPVPPPAYSAFPKNQIKLILWVASFAATFSPLSSFIFFPAIDDLARALDVSVGQVNLTITSYMIVAGLAPAILGDLADNIGRRMVYIFMMAVYCIANVGLALQSNWTALFLLRMLQSTGSAGMCHGDHRPSMNHIKTRYLDWMTGSLFRVTLCSRKKRLDANRSHQQPLRSDTVLCRMLLRHLNAADLSLVLLSGKNTCSNPHPVIRTGTKHTLTLITSNRGTVPTSRRPSALFWAVPLPATPDGAGSLAFLPYHQASACS